MWGWQCLFAARAGVHPGLRGFHSPIPTDGLQLLNQERLAAKRFVARLRLWVWRLAPSAPLLILLFPIAAFERKRELLWLVVMGGALAPITLIATRGFWLAPLSLLLVASTLGWNAFTLRSKLPAGHWTTPWGGVGCSSRIVPGGASDAWCIDRHTRVIPHFRLSTGFVLEQYLVPNLQEILTVNSNGAWVTSSMFGSPMYLSAGQINPVEIPHPHHGAVTDNNELWFVDVARRLRKYSIEQPASQRSDLSIPVLALGVHMDRSVWAGSVRQASRRHPISGQWMTYGPEAGLPGAVVAIASGSDGTVWFLQAPARSILNRVSWWVSALRPDGEWLHIDMRRLVGLQAPRGPDPLAVDDFGRLWITAVDLVGREKFLVLLNSDGTLLYAPFLLGRIPQSGASSFLGGNTRADPHGVVSDGDGGIYLYNGEREPLRRWRP